MKYNFRKIGIVIIVPLIFALIVHFIFGVQGWGSLFTVMSISFLFLVPFGIGALTIYLSDVEKVKSKLYRVFMPWVPIFAFLIATLFFGLEGWACWLMILPLFLASASLGGAIAGRYKLKKAKRENTYLSFIVLLPFLLSPLENWIGSIANVYEAYTFIDLKSDKAKIWQNVTRVKAI